MNNQPLSRLVNQQEKVALAASILSGILLFFSFPRYGTPLAAWIALLPLFYAIAKATPKEAFKYGFFTGFTCYIGTLYWIVYVVVKYGDMPVYSGIFALIALVCYLSLYLGLFACTLAQLRQYGWPQTLTAPFVWVIFEYLKSNLLTGFPWVNLGHSQHANLTLIQIADFGGVYVISFMIVLVNRVLYDLLILSREKFKLAAFQAIMVVFLLSSLIFYGNLRIEEVNSRLQTAPTLPVTVVQGNIDQNIKWNPAYQEETMRIYRKLTLEAVPKTGSLVVWPETATPFYFQENNPLSRMVLEISQQSQSWLLFGSPSYQRKEGKIEFFNSAFIVSPEKKVLDKYDKVHLVPYGEYVPLRRYFPFISKIVVGIGDFSSGLSYRPIETPGGRAGVLICYEAIFPHAAKSYLNKGAQLLINITNDAWFGNTSAPYQHLSMTVFRAVEGRRYLIRSANTGISAVISPTGAILDKSPLFQTAALRSEVKYMSGETFYAKNGDLFVLLCLIATLLLTAISMGRRIKK